MEKREKQAGFTLIELVATIILLGIIALIAVPIVSNIVNGSKESTYLASMKELIKAGEVYYADLGYIDKSCVSADSEELDYDHKGETIKGEVCFENGQVYLKDVIYQNFLYNGTLKDLSYVEYEEVIVDESPVPVYTLNDYTFDGVDDFVDTGYALFDELKDYTLVVSVTSNSGISNSAPPTVFHCMRESSPYPGIALDQQTTKGRIATNVPVKDFFSVAMKDNKNILVIKYDTASNATTYYIFDSNGNIVSKSLNVLTSTTFNQNLILGAYQKTDGTKGRFFNGTIHHFALYMETLEDDEITKIMSDLNN